MPRLLVACSILVALAAVGGCTGSPVVKKVLPKASVAPIATPTAAATVATATPAPDPTPSLEAVAPAELALPPTADLAAAPDDTLYIAGSSRLYRLVGTQLQAIAGQPGGLVPPSNSLDGLRATGVALGAYKLAGLDGGGHPLLLDRAPDGHTYRLNRLERNGRLAELATSHDRPMVLAVADGLEGAIVIESDAWPPGFSWPTGAVLMPPTYAALTHYEAFTVKAGQAPASLGRLEGDAWAVLAQADAFGRDVAGHIVLRAGGSLYQLDLTKPSLAPAPGSYTHPAVDGSGTVVDAAMTGAVALVRPDGTRQPLGTLPDYGGESLAVSLTPAGNTYLVARGKVYRLAGGKAQQLTGAGL